MCVVNKHFELLAFVFNSVYVGLKYKEICLTFTVCIHLVIIGMSVRLSRYPMWVR